LVTAADSAPARPAGRFAGKAAVVTGGGTGIGRATALRLAQEGAVVIVVGRRAEKLEESVSEIGQGGGKATLVATDLSKPDAASDIVRHASQWAGRLDVLVNAAGTFPSAPFPELTDDDWRDALEINLSAPMRLIRSAIPLFGDQAAVVNVSTINALIGDELSQCAHYAAAKAGLLGLTRQLAVELAPRGIRVNSVAPGAVATPMLEGWNEDPTEMRDWLERFVPIRRIAEPEEVASAIAFLASADASYITGVTLSVDGGMAVA